MINDVSANKLTAGTINGSVINVTNLNADNITTGTINGQRIGEGSLSLSKLEEDVYTESEVDAKFSTMQAEIDGAIETWTGTAVPTLNNAPASSWTTTAVRDTHVGDVYFVVNSQSEQNGYNYRFTKSGNSYSWQLIKDSDVTNALQRITAAEGQITTFDSDISQLKTDTGTLTTKTTSLETRMSDAEDDILDKVDVTTFNEVSDTVDGHTQSISQMSQTLSNKADSSTVTSLTNRVSKNEQDISGINTTIGELETTVESKADGSTVETMSNKLNTVSDTVDGHTQAISSVQSTLSTKADSSTVSTLSTKVNTISDTVDGHTQTIGSIQTTQTTMQTTLDKTLVETTQLWYSKANTTAPAKPTSQVTSTSTAGNAWRTVVPAYNASYPNYYYCYQWKYSDGTYGWSSVTRDIAMGESQATARTAASDASTAKTDASAAVTTANTASTNASTALSTAQTADSNASTALSTAQTADSNASAAVTTANTAASDATTAKNTANTAKSTADTAKATADKNVKESIQLWFTKANTTVPSKPTSAVTSNSTAGNAWRIVVPTYSSTYPYYYYCWQYKLADGTYTWSDVVYDRATTENQKNSHDALTQVSTKVETSTFNTVKNTVDSNSATITQLQTITTNNGLTENTNIAQTINNVKQTADSNSAHITNVVTTLGLAADGSSQSEDIVHKYNELDQTLDSTVSRVGTTESNVTGLTTRVSTAETNIAQNTTEISLRVTKSDYEKDVSVRLRIVRDRWTDSAWADHEAIGYTGDFANCNYFSTSSTRVETGFDGRTLKVGDLVVVEGVSTDTSTPHSLTGKVNSIPTSATGNINLTVVTATSSSGLQERISTAETSIEQNAEAIELNARKADASLAFVPFKHDADETWFWYATPASVFKSFSDDGWSHYEYTNSGSSTASSYIAPRNWDQVISGEQYTFLVEIKNYSGSTAEGTFMYIQQLAGAQFWGGNADKCNGRSPLAYGTYIYYDELASGSFTKRFVKTADTENIDSTAYDGLCFRYRIYLPAGVTTSFDIRISVYPGDYEGPYNEYLTATSGAQLKVANDAISARVEKDGVISAINLSSESAKIEASKVEIDGTAIFTAISSDVDDAITGKGYQTSSQVESAITSKGYQTSSQVESAITGKGYQTASQVSTAISNGTANLAAKSDTVKRTQRIWYRSNSSTAPSTPGTASSNWVTKADDGNAAWTKMHVAISSTHKYIYTCEQYEMANGTVGYTSVLLDNTITVIDGGNIITDSVKANAISSAYGTFDAALIPKLTSEHIDVDTISIGDLSGSIGGRNLLLGTGDPKTVTLAGASTDYYIGYYAESDYGKSLTNGNTADYMTVSFDWSTTSATGAAWLQIEGNIVTNISKASGYGTSKNRINLADGSGHYSATFRLSSTQAGKTTQRMRLRIAGSDTAQTAGSTFTLSNLMFVLGSVDVGHSPAPEDQTAYADSVGAQSAQPNLSPLTQASLTDVYNATTNPNGYWKSTPNSSWFTQLEDGWIRVHRDNSSGTAATNTTSFRPRPCPSVVPGETYTILIEVRNNHSTGDGATDMYIQPTANNQFWGSGGGNIQPLTLGETAVIHSRKVADSAHVTSTPNELFRYNARCDAGSVLDFELRLSLYEGEYDGPFKPYVSSKVDITNATNAAAKTATNYIAADSNGIKIANANPSTATTYQHQTATETDFVVAGGVRNRINADGMTLYNGSGTADTNVIAKFADELIELGKNSVNSIIKLCNGIGKIRAYKGSTDALDAYLTVESDASWTTPASESSDGNEHTTIYSSALDLYQGFGAAIGGFEYEDERTSAGLLSYSTVTARNSGQVELEAKAADGTGMHKLQFDPTGLSINNFDTPVYAFYAGTKLVAPSNGSATLLTASEVKSYLGSGANQTNTICLVSNGDGSIWGGMMTGAMMQDGSAKAFISPATTNTLRFNYILIRFKIRAEPSS